MAPRTRTRYPGFMNKTPRILARSTMTIRPVLLYVTVIFHGCMTTDRTNPSPNERPSRQSRLTGQRPQESVRAAFSSYYDGKRYDFRLTDEALGAMPSWSAERDAPPLPARNAERFARAYLTRLVDHPGKWRTSAICLHPLRDGKWVYVVRFSGPLPPGVIDGAVPTFRVVVTMDGDVPRPTVSPWP